jgi:hypothetical protein
MQTPMTVTWPEIFPKGKRNHERKESCGTIISEIHVTTRTTREEHKILNENEFNFQHKAEKRRGSICSA